MYSPYLGRFVSPDPLLNSQGGPLDYNPYIYARNNPYKYIDRNGEFGFLAAIGIGFLIGGTVNVACNWNNIHSWSDGFMFFGVGGVAGFAGAAVAVMAPAGVFAGALYGAIGGGLSGSILGGGNALLLGQDVGSAFFSGAWQGVLTGALFGGITGFVNAKVNGLNPWTGKSTIMATRHRPLMTYPDEMAAKSTPHNYESNVTKISPNMKGKLGVQRAMNEFVEDGGRVLQTEVTIEVDGVKIRPDFIGIDRNDILTIVEVKNGPHAHFTHNQGIVIPKMMGNEHPYFKPIGGNAAKIPDFRNVMINNQLYKGDYVFKKIHYFD